MKYGAGAIVLFAVVLGVVALPESDGHAQRGPRTAVSYDQIQSIFDDRCVRCHSGHTPPRGLDLSPGHSREIIGRASSGLPEMALVEPGDPSRSYLFLKLIDRHLEAGGSGRRCPIGGPPLPPPAVDRIESWIRAGAE